MILFKVVGCDEKLTISWSTAQQYLPQRSLGSSVALYNWLDSDIDKELFIIGGGTSIDISMIEINRLDTSASAFWTTTEWADDNNYGSISSIDGSNAFVHIDDYLYMAGLLFYPNLMLVYNLRSQEQVAGSEYNYSVPIPVTGAC